MPSMVLGIDTTENSPSKFYPLMCLCLGRSGKNKRKHKYMLINIGILFMIK